jgi:hypothetical protein
MADGVADAVVVPLPLGEVGPVTVVLCSNPQPVVRAAAAASAAKNAIDRLILQTCMQAHESARP